LDFPNTEFPLPEPRIRDLGAIVGEIISLIEKRSITKPVGPVGRTGPPDRPELRNNSKLASILPCRCQE